MLKKIAVTSLIAALFTAPFSAAASAQTVTTASSASASVSIQFSVESKVVVYGDSSVTLDYASYISQGQVMVPLRVWADLLQAEVWYDVKTKYVTLKKGNKVVKFLLHGNHIFVNGKKIMLKFHADKKHGLTYVPIRVIAYALGTDLHWDAKKRVVSFACGCGTVAGPLNVDGWKTGFADLPVNFDPAIYELDFRAAAVPDQPKPLAGLMLKGHNRSDDLFLYAAKKIGKSSGIRPNSVYKVKLDFDLATNQAAGQAGIGGAPAESVFVKAGVVNFEPKSVSVKEGNDLYYRMNLDKGNQAAGGQDMVVLGNIAKPDAAKAGYQLKSFTKEFSVRTDSDGEFYVVIGTDSGFEGLTTVYLANVSASLQLIHLWHWDDDQVGDDKKRHHKSKKHR